MMAAAIPANAPMVTNSTSNVDKFKLSLKVGWALMFSCAGLIIWSPRFSAFMSMFLRLQLPADVPRGVEPAIDLVWADRDWFSVGCVDAFTVLCYAVVVLLTTTAFDDGLGLCILTRSPNPLKLSRMYSYLLFEIISFIHAILATLFGHFSWRELWNGYETSSMPFIVKLFFVIQSAYYIHILLYNALISDADCDSIPSRKHIYGSLVVQVVATAFPHNPSLLPAIIVFMIPHTVLSISSILTQIIDQTAHFQQDFSSALAEVLSEVVKYGSLMECLMLSLSSIVFCCLGPSISILLKAVIVFSTWSWSYFRVAQCIQELHLLQEYHQRRMGRMVRRIPKPKVAPTRLE